jgi:predicted nucleic acid-binding protein
VIENAVLLDANIAAYALGDDSPQRLPCRRLLSSAVEGDIRAYASAEMIQEVVHHRLRRTGDPLIATNNGRDLAATCTVLAFDREVLELSLDLIERVPGLRGRDAVHAATAIAYGIDRIASTDPAFDAVPGITRLDPMSA